MEPVRAIQGTEPVREQAGEEVNGHQDGEVLVRAGNVFVLPAAMPYPTGEVYRAPP